MVDAKERMYKIMYCNNKWEWLDERIVAAILVDDVETQHKSKKRTSKKTKSLSEKRLKKKKSRKVMKG